ncbi:MAG TPA: hypothetical protein VGP55_12830 [Chitinophagaceae bacterium]|nr:hypothetical protein [Chitinophagaceae bacterium]
MVRLVAFIATVAFCIVQALQMAGVLKYPLDEILIFGTSLCIVIPFVIEILALHYVTPDDKKFWSHAALIFTVIYAVFVTANYVVQLTTVIPMSLKGDAANILILKQTPHSLFWDFDALGYIFMGLATFALVPVFEKKGFQKWIRLSLLANGPVTPLIATVYFYPTFSQKLFLLGLPWGITAPAAMLLLAMFFKKQKVITNQN